MTALSIWVMADDDVEPTIDTIQQLRERALVDVLDVAVVRWPSGTDRPETRPLPGLPPEGRLDSSFWGLLFGLTFFADTLGPGVGLAAGHVHEQLAALGIDENIADEIRAKVRPGRGALFVLSTGSFAENPERAAAAQEVLKGIEAELIRTNLSGEQAARVRGVFGVGKAGAAGAAPATPTPSPTPSADGAPAAFALDETYVHLDGSTATVVDGGAAFWEALESGTGGMAMTAIRRGGWLVGTFEMTETWASWECHPNGDEVVSCLSGRFTFRLDQPDGERSVELAAGRTVVVPRGVWHTASVHEPGACLHITAGAGTEHRPV